MKIHFQMAVLERDKRRLYQEKEMEAQSLVSHQHSWWFSCFSLREKLARSHKKERRSVVLQ
ncbi:hypothetical protein HO931_00305 [Streptococcus suis]|nr:hypothetical protein [Streptococcus suis]